MTPPSFRIPAIATSNNHPSRTPDFPAASHENGSPAGSDPCWMIRAPLRRCHHPSPSNQLDALISAIHVEVKTTKTSGSQLLPLSDEDGSGLSTGGVAGASRSCRAVDTDFITLTESRIHRNGPHASHPTREGAAGEVPAAPGVLLCFVSVRSSCLEAVRDLAELDRDLRPECNEDTDAHDGDQRDEQAVLDESRTTLARSRDRACSQLTII